MVNNTSLISIVFIVLSIISSRVTGFGTASLPTRSIATSTQLMGRRGKAGSFKRALDDTDGTSKNDINTCDIDLFVEARWRVTHLVGRVLGWSREFYVQSYIRCHCGSSPQGPLDRVIIWHALRRRVSHWQLSWLRPAVGIRTWQDGTSAQQRPRGQPPHHLGLSLFRCKTRVLLANAT